MTSFVATLLILIALDVLFELYAIVTGEGLERTRGQLAFAVVCNVGVLCWGMYVLAK